jgi:uncharacterized protein
MSAIHLEPILNDQLVSFLAPSADPWIPRSLPWQPKINTPEILIITGVRRSGKSSLMKMLAKQHQESAHIFYLNLDDPRLNSFSAEDFERVHQLWLGETLNSPKQKIFFFDEPQNVDGWEKWMNYFAEQKKTKVILTGSNARLLSSDLATHLTGRHRTLEILPFSFLELASTKEYGFLHLKEGTERTVKKQQLLRSYIDFGSFPRAFIDNDPAILGEYFKDIIYKDIVPRKGSGPSNAMFELGTTLMSLATQLVNKSKLAKQLGYKQARTTTKHIQFFIDSYLLCESRKFDASIRKRSRSLPKFFAIDHALAKQTGFRILESESFALENMVFLEFKRRGYEVFYWHSSKGYEVDIVARKMSAPICAAQVSLSIVDPKVREREVRALQAINKELKLKELFLITLADKPEEIDIGKAKIKVLPFADWAIIKD